jgi:5-methyltetrahydrofolate--homocysteine methyltransferase
VHVLDASRAVGVVNQLLGDETRHHFAANKKDEYRKLREAREAAGGGESKLIPLAAARSRREKIDLARVPGAPAFLGTRVFDDYPLAELVERIDWTPFFQAWELRGVFPKILEDPVVGEQASSLYKEARELLETLIRGKRMKARGVIGFFPAAALGDDIRLFTDARRGQERAILHCLRQQADKTDSRPNFCLADFVAPHDANVEDHVGAFIVTAGDGLDAIVEEFEKAHDDYRAIMAKALADRLAEAFAERLHERVRREFWGYEKGAELSNEEIVKERYAGIRPAPGYPACPDHTEKATLFQLLDGEKATGVTLTESFAMWPASSVSGWYFAHPQSHYFGVGKIARDQVEDYARRKQMKTADVERWLSPNLGYRT